MKNCFEIRTGRHCVFDLNVHLVFLTKYQKAVFDEKMLSVLKQIFAHVLSQFEAELIDFSGGTNYVHLAINYPPKNTVSKMVNSLKGVSSRRLKQQVSNWEKVYCQGTLWASSYFAGSSGDQKNTIDYYIKNR